MRTHMPSIHYFLAWAVLGVPAAAWGQANVQTDAKDVQVQLDRAHVTLTAVTPSVFRIAVAADAGGKPNASALLAIDPAASADCTVVKPEGMVGIQTPAGRLLIDPAKGEWTLQNAKGATLIPRFALLPATAAATGTTTLSIGWDKQTPIGVYGCGDGVDLLKQVKGDTHVTNGRATVPYYWCNSGYAVLGVSEKDIQPATWLAEKDGASITWSFPGTTADLYLMPAATLKDAVRLNAQLTGAAPVPPRWALGYMQSRWGWKDRAYIEDTTKQFIERKLPVDAFIFDFEWYTKSPDYSVPQQGLKDFVDFGWNPVLFPNPEEQVAALKKQGIHFVGIRKPRLGNLDTLVMARQNNFMITPTRRTDAYQSRDINFANPQLRDWYMQQMLPLLKMGVDGWWDDEGEGTFTTYYYWNLTESQLLEKAAPGQRLWTINRSFSPGLQRLGAGVWTGDIRSSWAELANTPVKLLNIGLSGVPYSGCDIGGFSGNPTPEMLTRWMEAGVFFPIMRSHSDLGATPRFPWLYGADAEAAIRKALELRYRLIPYYYSLAHETYETGVPMMRPLAMEYPDDAKTATMADEWCMGASLLAAPVLKAGGQRSVYLPAGQWYALDSGPRDSGAALDGGRTIDVTAALQEIPAYVRAGSILPLGPVVQHTADMPGGPLELRVYPGGDATFTLVEDDGQTRQYQKGNVRRTAFAWSDATGTLTWKTSGEYAGKDAFQNLHVVLMGAAALTPSDTALTPTGSVKLR